MIRLHKDPKGEHVLVIPTTLGAEQSQEIDSLKARVRELEGKLQSTSNSFSKLCICIQN